MLSFKLAGYRAGPGKVIFEVGGGGLREEIARDGLSRTRIASTKPSHVSSQALRLAAAKLPFRTEFITPAALPRLGNLLIPRPSPIIDDLSSIVALEDASAHQQSL